MKTKKTGIINILIIALALIAILSILTWAIPMRAKGAPLIITYSCAIVVILLEAFLTIGLIFVEKDKNAKILGLPILHFGYVTIVVQLVFTTIVYIVNAFIDVPTWIVIVLECLIFLVAIIHLAIGFFFKQRNKEFQNNKANTSFIDTLRAKIQIAVTNNSNKEIEKQLQDLFETVRGTDPVSNDNTIEVENRLSAKVADLNKAVDEKASADEVLELIDETKKLIQERSVLCKAGK